MAHQRFIVEDQSFAILRQHHFDVVVALRALRKQPFILPPQSDLDAVRERLLALLKQDGWRVLFNENEDINRIALADRGLDPAQALEMFQAIAPFVRRGSFLHLASVGHDERLWSWTFDGRACQQNDRVNDEDGYDEDDD